MAKAKTNKAGEKLQFQAEVSRLLDIVANSLYSDDEIFLRELISNASDACERLRYAALTEPSLASGEQGYHIKVAVDRKGRTISVADNGIGMSRDELIENLGTIARSGTAAFVGEIAEGSEKDISQIGQFGVGFYSAFTVADHVEVTSRRAGEDAAYLWHSDGKGEFTVVETERNGPGTTVVMTLRKGENKFLEESRLRQIITTYSDHILFPITLNTGKEGSDEPDTALNTASALWTRPRKDITAQQYKEFYHHVAHAGDDPWLTLHMRAEGVISYTGLLFIPSIRPFDLFEPERKLRIKLYVKRVFITDNCEGLLPVWLRFLQGVIDSEDLDLNISREMLQNNRVVAKIKSGITKRILKDLAKKAEKEPEAYAAFWENFGAAFKEGLYEPNPDQEALLKICRFHSTRDADLTSLEDYKQRMLEGQEGIYYIIGEDPKIVARSPHLEGFRARGIEVLLLTDPIDEFWVPAISQFEDTPFKSITQGGTDLSNIKVSDTQEKPEIAPEGDMALLIALLKQALEDQVKDVRVSERLTDSAVCLVADQGDLDLHLARLLKTHKHLDAVEPRILEINPAHKLIRDLAARAKEAGAPDRLKDAALLLVDQARILEGEAIPDPIAFSRRMTDVMGKSLAAE
jgi:molecular chaperone HtpG